MATDSQFLEDLSKRAGEAILEVYATDFEVTDKEDHTPLTQADMKSHRIIADGLQSRFPHIPVLSEEGREIPYATRKKWTRFWLIDPLDGTKEFIKRNGEFTVNIALIERNMPILGLVYLPVADSLFVGDTSKGCWQITSQERRPLHVRNPLPGEPVRVAKSRSHPSPNLEAILQALPSYESISRGSSLKFCAVATGEIHFYPRLGPTSEWDTAAGHAVVTAAGGVMVDLGGRPFTYNKESLLNGPFLVAPSIEWLRSTGIEDRAASL